MRLDARAERALLARRPPNQLSILPRLERARPRSRLSRFILPRLSRLISEERGGECSDSHPRSRREFPGEEVTLARRAVPEPPARLVRAVEQILRAIFHHDRLHRVARLLHGVSFRMPSRGRPPVGDVATLFSNSRSNPADANTVGT